MSLDSPWAFPGILVRALPLTESTKRCNQMFREKLSISGHPLNQSLGRVERFGAPRGTTTSIDTGGLKR